MARLQNKRVAFLAADGVEQIELTKPWDALKAEGAEVRLLSIEDGEIQGMNGMDKGDSFQVDAIVGSVNANDYDALVLPGGVKNPDLLRMNDDAVSSPGRSSRRPSPSRRSATGRGCWSRPAWWRGGPSPPTPASGPTYRNAGGTWVDEEVHVDAGMVTSRKPDDLDAFIAKTIEESEEGRHEGQSA